MPYIPPINNEFVLIVDWAKPDLANVILSYIAQKGQYTPIFGFPAATVAKSDEFKRDEHVITRIHAPQFDTFTSNAINRMRGCKTLILAGLSENQRSYLTFLDAYNVIDIPSVKEVDFFLSVFQADNQYLPCRSADLANGLLQAVAKNHRLRIDEDAPPIDCQTSAIRDTILIVEKRNSAATPIALNYALSVDADVVLVDPLADREENIIKTYIEDWRNGSAEAYTKLSEAVTSRIWEVDFAQYTYATFFTTGLPYSLILKDSIQSTYVHFHKRPDFFIFNNIVSEHQGPIGGAIVFSPQQFYDEETTQVIEVLEKGNYFVNKLVGADATVHNIDMAVRDFPYDLLHFCSHGGEIGGYSVTGTFTERDGNHHTYEYDEVVSFAPVPGKDEIIVTTKRFTRKFDGLTWRSPELDNKDYPHYVFSDMEHAMEKGFKEKTDSRKRKSNISGSCAIKCSDFVYQAMINVVAGAQIAPVVFNNTCWSWADIAEGFLDSGSRGYVGTLWNVGNKEAAAVARVFYQHIFTLPFSESLHIARAATIGTDSENIYIYWGLPFSTLKPSHSIADSREGITHRLLRSFYHWTEAAQQETRPEIKKNMENLADWGVRQLSRYFHPEYFKIRSSKK